MHLRWLGLSLFVPAIVIACVGDSAIVGNPPDSSVANDARVESGADVAALPDAGWSPATLDAANQPCADLAVGEDTFAPSGQSASRIRARTRTTRATRRRQRLRKIEPSPTNMMPSTSSRTMRSRSETHSHFSSARASSTWRPSSRSPRRPRTSPARSTSFGWRSR